MVSTNVYARACGGERERNHGHDIALPFPPLPPLPPPTHPPRSIPHSASLARVGPTTTSRARRRARPANQAVIRTTAWQQVAKRAPWVGLRPPPAPKTAQCAAPGFILAAARHRAPSVKVERGQAKALANAPNASRASGRRPERRTSATTVPWGSISRKMAPPRVCPVNCFWESRRRRAARVATIAVFGIIQTASNTTRSVATTMAWMNRGRRMLSGATHALRAPCVKQRV